MSIESRMADFKIQLDHAREKGYTLEHDKDHGMLHLITEAKGYLADGYVDKAGGLLLAMEELYYANRVDASELLPNQEAVLKAITDVYDAAVVENVEAQREGLYFAERDVDDVRITKPLLNDMSKGAMGVLMEWWD